MMRDALKDLAEYFDEHWFEVPLGAIVPMGTHFAAVHGGLVSLGAMARPTRHSHGLWYTPEPLAPELPTETGALIKAHTENVTERRAFMRTASGSWSDGYRDYDEWALINPVLLATIPNGGGVMDETNKAPAIDSSGDRWDWNPLTDMWICPKWSEALGSKAAIASECGLLRPADEGGDQ